MNSPIHRLIKQTSIVTQPGMEGNYISRDCFKGRRIAVLTSGGDAPGMNSAVRAVVRMGIYCGCSMFTVKEGYQGLVDGGKNIVEASWASVSGIMQVGGTVIGSARCAAFREKAGRRQAAMHLVKKGISNLVVVGGDGSLTGANAFKQEWPELLAELLAEGSISAEEQQKNSRFNIVGLVGSIDNDFCGTDMTIGTDSALHRILEACDAISSTAHSHQRCFILEVMGRHCGYLALVTALASEAEWVFIPEAPVDAEGEWRHHLCTKLARNRDEQQRVNIIIVAEGAQDTQGRPITANDIKELITNELQIDTRITVLGHVQRGGAPSAFDLILGIRMGAEAVLALMDADKDPNQEACVIALNGNQTVRVPLMKCVLRTKAVGEAMKKGDFEKAVELRGKSFGNNLNTYLMLSKSQPPKEIEKNMKCIAVLNVGAPACGMNAVVRSFTRIMISRGYDVIGFNEGFEGVGNNKFEELNWLKVKGWTGLGGSMLGIRRDTPESVGFQVISDRFEQYNLAGLIVIGGFEAYKSVLQLYKARDKFPAFNIPMVAIPATISNNVPGSDFSLGADTSLNEITKIVEKIKQSAVGTKRRVFVIETQGAFCGYLATMSGLAGGADAAYIHEEPFDIDDLRSDVQHMRAKIADNVQRGLILVNEKANKNYNSDFICRLYAEESRGLFDARTNVPGHLQQGGAPSPFDRNLGVKIGSKASQWFEKYFAANENGDEVTDYSNADKNTACLLGIIGSEYQFTPVIDLEQETDFKHRIPKEQWWMNLRSLMRIMAKHESLYASDAIMSRMRKQSTAS